MCQVLSGLFRLGKVVRGWVKFYQVVYIVEAVCQSTYARLRQVMYMVVSEYVMLCQFISGCV